MNNQNFNFMELPLIQLAPSSTNPRKYFSESDLDSLAESIKEKGVLQPIIVRPDADGFEIVCGERRFRAAQKAGLEKIVCRVQELTDDEVLDLQIIENLQRKDVSPLEEANGFDNLIKSKKKLTVKEIAIRVGKSEVYVYNRLLLLQLSEKAKQLLEDNTITVSHALELCKLASTEHQDTALDNILEYEYNEETEEYDLLTKVGTLKELRSTIKRYFKLELEYAIFDTKDSKLVPNVGACTKCSKRTGANTLLFEGLAERDCCLDASCFNSKGEAHLLAVREAKQKEIGKDVNFVTYRAWDSIHESIVENEQIVQGIRTLSEIQNENVPAELIKLGIVVSEDKEEIGTTVEYISNADYHSWKHRQEDNEVDEDEIEEDPIKKVDYQTRVKIERKKKASFAAVFLESWVRESSVNKSTIPLCIEQCLDMYSTMYDEVQIEVLQKFGVYKEGVEEKVLTEIFKEYLTGLDMIELAYVNYLMTCISFIDSNSLETTLEKIGESAELNAIMKDEQVEN